MTAPRTMIPSARRLMASLRHIGYNTPAAVADLVDNCIDANARRVAITLHHAGVDSYVRVADDGTGMTARELDEAMRYGSSRTYGTRDLGRFGLGLKTASLSQCRRLTVASRTTPRGRVEIRRWDLDRVAALDEWTLERLTPRQCPGPLLAPLGAGPGTVVLWERLDRVLGYARPDGSAAEASLQRSADEVGAHLSMVMHRFLAGELRRGRSRVGISVNGRAVEPWDPYSRNEPKTQALPSQWIRLRHGGRTHRVRVRPFILPAQAQFSTPEAHATAGGPGRWNRQQGLYIYRRDRLIQAGGWNRLRTMDEHSKLARIAVDVPAAADEAFGTNVSKMTVALPESIRPDLRALASGVVGRAQETYRQRMRLVDVDRPRVAPPADADRSAGWHLGDQWSTVVAVLERELVGHPELLRRVLVALANSRSESARFTAAADLAAV